MNRKQVAQELVKIAKSIVANGKSYNTQMNVGKAKYVVNYHDGKKTHGDGSPFYDVAIFSNKKVFADFVKNLKRQGYTEES